MRTRLLALALLAGLSAPAVAQLPPEKALASMKAADGLQVELFAAEPMLVNPTSIDIEITYSRPRLNGVSPRMGTWSAGRAGSAIAPPVISPAAGLLWCRTRASATGCQPAGAS